VWWVDAVQVRSDHRAAGVDGKGAALESFEHVADVGRRENSPTPTRRTYSTETGVGVPRGELRCNASHDQLGRATATPSDGEDVEVPVRGVPRERVGGLAGKHHGVASRPSTTDVAHHLTHLTLRVNGPYPSHFPLRRHHCQSAGGCRMRTTSGMSRRERRW